MDYTTEHILEFGAQTRIIECHRHCMKLLLLTVTRLIIQPNNNVRAHPCHILSGTLLSTKHITIANNVVSSG